MRRTTDRARAAAVALALLPAAALPPASAGEEGERAAFERVARLFAARCLSCHSGKRAEQGLRLERESIYRSTVNVRSRADARLLRVAPGDPERSLLYRIVLPPEEGGYRGPRMPLAGHPLAAGERAIVRAWIEAFDAELWRGHEQRSRHARPPEGERPRGLPVLPDSHLINLSAPDTLPRGMFQYRILHRFRVPAATAGGRDLYGLDGGAWISFGVAYGLGEAFEIGLRRTNFERDYELHAKGRFLAQPRGAPISLAGQLSAVRLDGAGSANRNRVTAALIAGRRFRRVSLVLEPVWVSRANWSDPGNRRGTLALGAGAEVRLNEFVALTGEWMTQLSGVAAPYEGAGIGLSLTTSKHVFHIVLTNVPGLHTDLWAVGGDVDVAAGDFRLGFNISRLFDATHGH